MPQVINRTLVSQALAKAIAYKQCGMDLEAALWAIKLVKLLELSNILSDTSNTVSIPD